MVYRSLIERREGLQSDAFDRSRPIAFACHMCGDCCRGLAIILSPFDLMRLASHTGESPRAIVRERCVVLKHPQTGLPSVMLETIPKCSYLADDNRCTVYSDRPMVCRAYPLGVFVQLDPQDPSGPLDRFTMRASPCPPPRSESPPLPVVRTMHQMATDERLETYARAYRLWARLVWDIAAKSRYGNLPPAEQMLFDRAFTAHFFEELPVVAGEAEALAAFERVVEAFRGEHKLPEGPAVGATAAAQGALAAAGP